MKIYLLFILLPFLFSSNNRIKNQAASDDCRNNSTQLISIIENYWEDNHLIYVRLSETGYVTFFDKKNQPEFKLKIADAFNKGMPLFFKLNQKEITCILQPEERQAKAYLNTYDPIQYYQADALKWNPKIITCFSQLSIPFFRFMEHNYGISEVINFDMGCEARAGIISHFLNEKTGLINYKLFLNGKIKFQSAQKKFCWVNHVLNLISFKEKGITCIYIFDPFMLNVLIPLDNYITQLKENGSTDLQYRITDSNVFVCYANTHIGMIDSGYTLTKTIFNNLYVMDH